MSEAKTFDQNIEKSEADTPHFFGLQHASDAAQPSEIFIKPLVPGTHLRSGDLCPQCRAEHLDYDGLLDLTCPGCGFSPGGGCFS